MHCLSPQWSVKQQNRWNQFLTKLQTTIFRHCQGSLNDVAQSLDGKKDSNCKILKIPLFLFYFYEKVAIFKHFITLKHIMGSFYEVRKKVSKLQKFNPLPPFVFISFTFQHWPLLTIFKSEIFVHIIRDLSIMFHEAWFPKFCINNRKIWISTLFHF